MPVSRSRICICVMMYALLMFVPKCYLWYVAVHQGSCVPNPHSSGDHNASEATSVVINCSMVPVEACCGTATSQCAFRPGLYHSSDFEVHRNWLSIVSERQFSWLRERRTTTTTNNDDGEGRGGDVEEAPLLTLLQSLRYWYRDATSLWTLDYPPFFAWYELAMYQFLVWSDGSPEVRAVFFKRPELCSAMSSVGLGQLRRAAGETLKQPTSLPLHSSQGIVAFQRATVILFSDVPYFIATTSLFIAGCNSVVPNKLSSPSVVQLMLPLLVACSPAWTIIDSIHFQYNGFIFAVFMMSMICVHQGRPFAAATWYVVLVFLKHMMAYFALGYAVWGVAVVLRGGKCVATTPSTRTTNRQRIRTLTQFIGCVVAVIMVAFVPFIASEYDHLSTTHLNDNDDVVPMSLGRLREATSLALLPIKDRLFPFGRGLVHAYWAPNTYALYSAADVALCKALPVLSKRLPPMAAVLLDGVFPRAKTWCGRTSVNTKGLVGLEGTNPHPPDSTAHHMVDVTELMRAPTHAALPPIVPLMSHALVVLCFVGGVAWLVLRVGKSVPRLRTLEWWSSPEGLLWATFWSAASFYLFSWHVHEKAILSVLLPVVVHTLRHSPSSPWDTRSTTPLQFCVQLNVVATATVFPLMFTSLENVVKYSLFGVFAVVPYLSMRISLPRPSQPRDVLTVVLWICLVLASLWVDATNMATFAPLMLMSSIGAVTVHITMFTSFFWQ